jgi:predicted RNA binding protein YcfA (HicA-like mRNA interferase family)
MKRIPRDISGYELSKRIGKIGYDITRQTGSHMRLTTKENGIHHITIPIIAR